VQGIDDGDRHARAATAGKDAIDLDQNGNGPSQTTDGSDASGLAMLRSHLCQVLHF